MVVVAESSSFTCAENDKRKLKIKVTTENVGLERRNRPRFSAGDWAGKSALAFSGCLCLHIRIMPRAQLKPQRRALKLKSVVEETFKKAQIGG